MEPMSGTNEPSKGTTTDSTDYSRMPKKSNTTTWVIAIVVIVVVIALLGYAWGAGLLGNKTTPSAASCPSGVSGQAVSGQGSTFVYPLMTFWSTSSVLPCGIALNYLGVGSGAGIAALTQKSVDFGASDAPLSATQRVALPHAAATIPEAIGAVTVMYNIPGVAKGLNLTGPIVASIYLGDISNWNVSAITSINPGVKIPNQAIKTVERADSSGTTYVFTNYLKAENATWATKVGAGTSVVWPVTGGLAEQGSLGVAGQVKSLPGAIGYAELNYAALGGVAYAKLLNPGGAYVLPTAASTAAAAAALAASLPAGTGDWANVSMLNQAGAGTYPLASFTYVMVYTDLGVTYGSAMTQAHATALVQFLWYATHAGQSPLAGLFYVPLPTQVVTVDETTISGITFNGASLTSH